MNIKHLKLDRIQGPLVVMSNVGDVSYDEMVEIELMGNQRKKGKVVQIDGDKIVLQVFEGTDGFSVDNASVEFTGESMKIPVGNDMFGRIFNGVGEPIDGRWYYPDEKHDILGRSLNPVARVYPRNYIQTGISSIDGLITLIRGQKLPIFSGDGISHNELAAQIIKQARLSEDEDNNFGIVFAAMGIKHDEYEFFKKEFVSAGVQNKVVMYVNLSDEPIVERIATPRCALTAAEYLAFEQGMHVLVIMTNITSYCEAIRELSSAKEEVPSRKGYPGYLYSDLASLYERAGIVKDSNGSITQIPILTMPNDDITHPIADLTGYITEGQILLSRELYQKNLLPPINILPSLSRLMKDGIGEKYTREDHADVSNQIFYAYSKVIQIRELAQVIGEDDLSDIDKLYMEFGRNMEDRLINQGFNANRSIYETLDLMWDLLRILPENELERISPELVKKYFYK